MVLRGLCGSSFSARVLCNGAKLSMYAVDQYAILCVSSMESHRVPDCQRKKTEDTEGVSAEKYELCPLIVLFINIHFASRF